MRATYEDLAVLRFQGDRFANHTLDVDTTQELIAYKKLVLECAKELWRRRNPGRTNLPGGFEKGFSIVFSEMREGSVGIPLKRRIEREDDELDLPPEDEFPMAARMIDETIEAAGAGETLPAELPRNVIPLFREFGKTLSAEESVFTRATGRSSEAAYSAVARERLATWAEPTYEDVVELHGEVSMANVRGGQFALVLEDGRTPNGRFNPEQETLVLEALCHHRDVRLRVRGTGEFNQADRSLRRLVRVDHIEIATAGPAVYDESVPPIWEVVTEIGVQAPRGTWDNVPRDLSNRVDEYIYGTPPSSQ